MSLPNDPHVLGSGAGTCLRAFTRISHWDRTRAKRARLVNLRPSTKSISLRLPIPLLEQIKIAANQRDVPYQSLIKVWLAERVEDE